MARLRLLLSSLGREALVASVLVMLLVAAQTAVLWRALARESDVAARAVQADLDALAREKEAAWQAELASHEHVPSFALRFVLHESGALELDGRPVSTEADDETCLSLGWQLSAARAEARRAHIDELVRRCPLVRGPSGMLLLPSLAEAGELDAATWQRWQDEHPDGGQRDVVGDLERVRELLRQHPLREPGGRRLETADLLAQVERQAGRHTGWIASRESVRLATPTLARDDLRARISAQPGTRMQAPVHLGPLTLTLVVDNPSVVQERTAKSRALFTAASVASLVLALGFFVFLLRRLAHLRKESELRVDFVAAVSHELRTPIASIRLLAELLARDLPANEQAEALTALDRAAHRLADRAERWLTLAQLGRGELHARRQSLDLAQALRDAVERGDLPGTTLAAPDRLPWSFDPLLFDLSVENLMENARKYGDGPYAFTLVRQGDEAVLTYEDSGTGFGPAAERLLLPFERGDTRLHRATEGVGLGLSLIASAAKAHGGSVSLGAREGGGARVRIVLPKGDS